MVEIIQAGSNNAPIFGGQALCQFVCQRCLAGGINAINGDPQWMRSHNLVDSLRQDVDKFGSVHRLGSG
jgi:hypothetical protein